MRLDGPDHFLIYQSYKKGDLYIKIKKIEGQNVWIFSVLNNNGNIFYKVFKSF